MTNFNAVFLLLQKSQTEAFLSSCSEAQVAGLTIKYMDEADDFYAYLVTTVLTPLPALPASSTAPMSECECVNEVSGTVENSTEVTAGVAQLSIPAPREP
jgi:hypothetical protein